MHCHSRLISPITAIIPLDLMGVMVQNTVQKVITKEYIKFRVLFPASLAGHTSASKVDNYSVTCETEHLLVRGLNAACA